MASVRPDNRGRDVLYGLRYAGTETEEGLYDFGDNRGQRLSSFDLVPICFGPKIDAEYEK